MTLSRIIYPLSKLLTNNLIKKGISTVSLEDIVSEFLWSIEPPFQTIQSYTGSHAD